MTIQKNDQIEDSSLSHEVELNSLMSDSFYMFQNYSSYSMEQIKNYTRHPMVYNAILREISKQAYSVNGLYGNTIDRMVALPTLSYITTMRNSKSKKIKNVKSKFVNILKLLNIERTTRDILRSLFIEGMYVGILRDTTTRNKVESVDFVNNIERIEGLSIQDNFMIQPLDNDYCKIIGVQNNVSVAAFDMSYFDQYKGNGLVHEIKNFPQEFVKAYSAYKKDRGKRWYILSPTKTIALKAKASELEAYGRPLGISALADMKFGEDYNDSQYQLIMEIASSIYYMILPESETKGQCSLNKEQQKNQIEAFKGAVKLNTSNRGGSKISTLSLAPGTKIDRLAKDSSLLKDTLSDEIIKKISTNIGFASSALNAESSSTNLGSLEININLITALIFQNVNEIARELTRVINEHLGIKPINYIEIKYLPITWLNRKEIYDKAKDLYLTAGGSRKYYIAAAGFDPEDYLSVCDEEIEAGFDQKYLPHITSYTATDKADEPNPDGNLGGRPQKDTDELKDSGIITREYKSNEQRIE